MNLIYLLSLPRSGSTLLQRLLGTHPEVKTASETWLQLPLVSVLRDDLHESSYDHEAAVAAIRDFVGKGDEGDCKLRTALEAFTDCLLEEVVDDPDQYEYFLDKTPRYSLIGEDLVNTYGDARFVVLWRNPLAIASSISRSWGEGKWNLNAVEIDLYECLDHLVDLVERYPSRIHTLKYEDLVRKPEQQTKSIFQHLGLVPDVAPVDQFQKVKLKGQMGDSIGVQRYRSISTKSLGRWSSWYCNPVRRMWARRYLDWIGTVRLSRMGYSKTELISDLNGSNGSLSFLGSDLLTISTSYVHEKLHGAASRLNSILFH